MPYFKAINHHEADNIKNKKKEKTFHKKEQKKSLPWMCSCIKFTFFIFDSMKMCHTDFFFFSFLWLLKLLFTVMQVLFSSGETQDVLLFYVLF